FRAVLATRHGHVRALSRQTHGVRLLGQFVRRPVRTYRQLLEDHFRNPEARSVGPNGEVCSARTVGFLARRPVIEAAVAYVGKESNRLEEREAGLISDENDFLQLMAVASRWNGRPQSCPMVRALPTAEAARRTGFDRSTVKRLKRGALPR